MWMPQFLRRRLADRYLTRVMADGIDLRELRFMPDTITLPLRRDGVDPLPELTRVRGVEPVRRLTEMFGVGVWLVSGYDQARELLADHQSFSNDLGRFVPQEGRDPSERIGGLGMSDAPDHTVLRRYLTPEFTMRRLARLHPVIDEIVERRLDEMERRGPRVDLVEHFAFPIPFDLICELLGLPVEDREHFRRLGSARFDLNEGGSGVFGAAAESRQFLIEQVAKQRLEPGPGLIGALLREHGDDLDDVTLGGLADGVFLGGYETSASMLALGAHLVTRNPEAMRMLREGDDDTVDRVVEELLRHLAVVQLAFLRIARVDVEIGGRLIQAGDVVGVSLLAANRDPLLTEDPDTFDPTREPTRHLAFGHGIHRCVGAELARMELRTALRGLARRFPDLKVAEGELEFRSLSAVYGVEALPVLLSGRATAQEPRGGAGRRSA